MISQLIKDRRGSAVVLLVIALLNMITNDAVAQSQPNAVERGKAIAQHWIQTQTAGALATWIWTRHQTHAASADQ